MLRPSGEPTSSPSTRPFTPAVHSATLTKAGPTHSPTMRSTLTRVPLLLERDGAELLSATPWR